LFLIQKDLRVWLPLLGQVTCFSIQVTTITNVPDEI
jgi:hypothetical protein